MVENEEDLGASPLRDDRATDERSPSSGSSPVGSVSHGAARFPRLRFDDISRPREDDGLGYIYLEDGGCSPTVAHTGDKMLSADQNRAFGNLFAAAPDLHDALADILDYEGGADSALDDEYVMERARAALSRVRGEGV